MLPDPIRVGPLALHVSLPSLLRFAAWGCIAVLAVLSLMPGKEMLRTDLAKLGHGKQVEHFIAYFGATTLFGLAYQTRLTRLMLVAILIPYAALLEIGQLFTPGRGASVMDFAASAAGVVAGALLIPMAWRVATRALAAGASKRGPAATDGA